MMANSLRNQTGSLVQSDLPVAVGAPYKVDLN
jgi:hypothetical protein